MFVVHHALSNVYMNIVEKIKKSLKKHLTANHFYNSKLNNNDKFRQINILITINSDETGSMKLNKFLVGIIRHLYRNVTIHSEVT